MGLPDFDISCFPVLCLFFFSFVIVISKLVLVWKSFEAIVLLPNHVAGAPQVGDQKRLHRNVLLFSFSHTKQEMIPKPLHLPYFSKFNL